MTPKNTCCKLDWIPEKWYYSRSVQRNTCVTQQPSGGLLLFRGATVAWSSVLFKAFSRLMRGPESVSLLRLCGQSASVFSHAAAKNRSHALLPRSSSTETCELIWKRLCQRERWERNREPVLWPFLCFLSFLFFYCVQDRMSSLEDWNPAEEIACEANLIGLRREREEGRGGGVFRIRIKGQIENWSQWKTLLRKYACANEHMWSIGFLITGNVCWAGPLFWAPPPPPPQQLCPNLTQILPDAAAERLCTSLFL